jgi:4-hydroxybenzoate polyprenyltransferase
MTSRPSFIHKRYVSSLQSCHLEQPTESSQQAVGTFSALAGPALTSNEAPSLSHILSRIPLVFLWNWLNLIVFNIANQRLPDSVLEDQINKPWRPIPSNRLTSNEARQLLLYVLPCSLCLLYFIGPFEDALWMVVLTWMYNDLGGADVSTTSQFGNLNP